MARHGMSGRAGGRSWIAVEPRIRELLQAWPTMPATVIAERIGWTSGLTVLKDRVRELRPVYLPPDPASRTAYAAGEVAQCDLWFPAITLPVGFGQIRTATRLPVLVMVTGYARWLAARLIPSRAAEDLFAGWWQLLAGLGGVPRVLVWDGEGAVGQRRRRQTVLTEAGARLPWGAGRQDPDLRSGGSGGQGAGRAGQWLSGDLVPARPDLHHPGRLQRPAGRLARVVNQRHRRVLGCAPADRIEADRAAMLPLPPVAPPTGWHHSLRLPRDHYVRLDSNDYSVHPAVVGRRVRGRAPTWSGCGCACDGRLVADHVRCWARHQTLSDPAHLRAAAQLRHDRAATRRRQPAPRPGRGRAALPGRLRRRLRPGRPRGWPDGRHHDQDRRRDLTAELVFLTRALKAPTLRESVARLAERARAEGWSHEEFLAACLQREVAAREAHGGEGRIRQPASRPARAWRSSTSTTPAASSASSHRPPGHPGLRHRTRERGLPRPTRDRQDPSGHRPGDPRLPGRPPGGRSPPPPSGSTCSPTPMPPAGCNPSWSGWAATRCWSSTRSATSPSRPRPPTCSSSWSRPATNAPA